MSVLFITEQHFLSTRQKMLCELIAGFAKTRILNCSFLPLTELLAEVSADTSSRVIFLTLNGYRLYHHTVRKQLGEVPIIIDSAGELSGERFSQVESDPKRDFPSTHSFLTSSEQEASFLRKYFTAESIQTPMPVVRSVAPIDERPFNRVLICGQLNSEIDRRSLFFVTRELIPQMQRALPDLRINVHCQTPPAFLQHTQKAGIKVLQEPFEQIEFERDPPILLLPKLMPCRESIEAITGISRHLPVIASEFILQSCHEKIRMNLEVANHPCAILNRVKTIFGSTRSSCKQLSPDGNTQEILRNKTILESNGEKLRRLF